MKLLDVNVLVDAFRPDTAGHADAYEAVDRMRRDHEPIVILPEIAAGFLRIVTRRGVFDAPNTSEEAMQALDAWTAVPSVAIGEAGPGRWQVFRSLMGTQILRGNDVHDALLAAAAIDLGATLVTRDRGFARFDDLRLELI